MNGLPWHSTSELKVMREAQHNDRLEALGLMESMIKNERVTPMKAERLTPIKGEPLLEITRREQFTPPTNMSIKMEPISSNWKKTGSTMLEPTEFKRDRSAPIITNRLPITTTMATPDQGLTTAATMAVVLPPTPTARRRYQRKPIKEKDPDRALTR